jgi:hypothetical protein
MTTPPDPDNLPIDCDDTPKLTAEEWDYIGQLTDQPGEHAAPEDDG